MKKFFITFAILLMTAVSTFAAGVNPQAIMQYNDGIDFYKAGDYEAAINSFQSAIKTDPSYIDAYYNLGSVLEYCQRYNDALNVFKQVIVRQPNDYDSVYKAAWLSAKLGQYKHAMEYLSIIPTASPRGADAKALEEQIKGSVPQAEAKGSTPKPATGLKSQLFSGILSPTGVTTDSRGNLYVAEFTNNAIMKVTPAGKKILFVKNPRISGPMGLACDKAGNVYVANYNKNNVLKISTVGEISVLLSNIKRPYCLYYTNGMLFISSQGSNSVLRYKL
jgi:tetratricopeptide (TPR) repeat protein